MLVCLCIFRTVINTATKMNRAISQNCNGKELGSANDLRMLSGLAGAAKYQIQPTWKIRTLMKPNTVALTI